MKKENISDALNYIDFDMVEDVYESTKANEDLNYLGPDLEKYTLPKDRLRQKNKKPKSVWLRFGAIAACFLLIVSAVIVVPMLREDDPDNGFNIPIVKIVNINKAKIPTTPTVNPPTI